MLADVGKDALRHLVANMSVNSRPRPDDSPLHHLHVEVKEEELRRIPEAMTALAAGILERGITQFSELSDPRVEKENYWSGCESGVWLRVVKQYRVIGVINGKPRFETQPTYRFDVMGK